MTDQEVLRHRLNRAKGMRGAWQIYDRTEQPRLADMLADLMHLAESEGIDFNAELTTATDFYTDEK